MGGDTTGEDDGTQKVQHCLLSRNKGTAKATHLQENELYMSEQSKWLLPSPSCQGSQSETKLCCWLIISLLLKLLAEVAWECYRRWSIHSAFLFLSWEKKKKSMWNISTIHLSCSCFTKLDSASGSKLISEQLNTQAINLKVRGAI